MRKPRIVLFGCILGGSLLGQAAAEPVKTDTELQQALLPKEARDLPVRDSAAPLRLTLEQVIKQVLARSPSAQSALLDIKRAQALQEQARAGSLPTLAVLASYNRLDNDRIFGAPGMERLVAGADQLSGNVTLAMPLLAPARWAQWLHAADSVEVAKRAVAEARRQLAIAAGRAYLSALAQQRVVVVQQRAVTTAQAHLDFALQRLSGGIGTRLDSVRAAQEQAVSEAQLATARAGLARTQLALSILCGTEQRIEPAESPQLQLPPTLNQALGEAQVARGDLKLLQARAWAAARLVRHSFVDYLPTLQGSFAPFYQNPPSLVQPLVGWQARLDLTLPLFDGGLRYGMRHERQALYQQSRLAVLGGRITAQAEVRIASESLARAKEGSLAAHRSAQLAAESLQLSTLAWRAGASTNLEVVDAERRARDAETLAVQAEDAVLQAQLELLVASGHFPEALDG